MSDQEKLKARAAEYVLSFIQDNMIIGLGTGSTVKYFLQGLLKKIHNDHLKNIKGIPSSRQTENIARELNIPLTSFDEHQTVDITVDGADEVDPNLDLIKGHGGALTREKIVACASARMIVIVDESKLVSRLGDRFTIPVEIVKFGWRVTCDRLENLTECFAEIKMQADAQGLCSKENFLKILDTEVQRACRYRASLALCLMKVNFNEDETVADNPVKEGIVNALGESFAREIRSWDSLSRFGRKTFALLMPQSSREEAQNLCNRLQRIFDDSRSAGGVRSATITFGLSEMTPDGEENAADLLERAADFLAKGSPA